jgi:hypothetical protein
MEVSGIIWGQKHGHAKNKPITGLVFQGDETESF